MRKNLLRGALFFCVAALAGAQPKVAVLDAVLGEGIPANAGVITADLINEQFVKAPQFTAIERAAIARIQDEKKFQLSGDVDEADIQEIGNTFGAEYLCLINTSVLGTTYTVSARLVEVGTAEVYSQESFRMRGESDILFMLAEIVGAELAGVDLAAAVGVPLSETVAEPPLPAGFEEALAAEPPAPSESPALAETPAAKPAPAAESAPAAKPAPEAGPSERRERKRESGPYPIRGHFMVSLSSPEFFGPESFLSAGGNSYDLYEAEDYLNAADGSFSDAATEKIGVDVHYLAPLAGPLYYSLGFTWTDQLLTAKKDGTDYEWDIFQSYETYAGLGAAIAPTSFWQFYGGLTLGLMVLRMGEDHNGAADPFWGDVSDREIAGKGVAGISGGFEIGSNLYWGSFGLDLRYRWTRSREMGGDSIFSDVSDLDDYGYQGLMVGIGFLF